MTNAYALLFDPPREAEHDRNRHYGIFPAIVTNNVDPEGMYRVKVRFPHLPGENESFWARVATAMAGKDRGWYFLPEVDDEVLVMFEHGDVHHPIVVGQIWNGRDVPPHDNADGKNNLRFFRSRNGHRVILDDTEGAEKIVIAEKSGKNRIVIDAVKNSIQVLSEDGDITLNAPKGALKVDATSWLVHATDSLKITSGGEFAAKTGGTTTVSAGPSLDLKSGRTELNPSSGGGGGGAAAATLEGDDTISKLTAAAQKEGEVGSYGESSEAAPASDPGKPPEPPPVLVKASYSKPQIAPGEDVTMTVDTVDFPEGETITMDVFERDGAKALETITAQVKGGKATFEWKWDKEKHRGESDVPVSQYEFKATGKGKESASAIVEVVDWVEIEITTPFGEPVRSQRWIVRTEDGKEHTGSTDGEGVAKLPATLHGEVAMEFPDSHLLFKLELE